MNRSLSTAAALILCAASANAQSFNVDIDAPSGNPGAGLPPSSYGGAADQPGTWNASGLATPFTTALERLNGTTSSATFTRPTTSVSTGGNLMIFDFASLYNDWHSIAAGAGELVYSFNNLEAGDYLLYTYAHSTGTGGLGVETEVEVVGANGPDIIDCGGFLSANSFSQFNISHVIHSKTVSAGGSITIKIRGTTGAGVVNGFQLVKLPGAGFPVRKYVDKDAAFGFYEGNSWAEPYQNLNDALDFAAMVGGGNCEIWVASGFYYPTRYQTGTDRTASFVIPSGVKLYGGFNGTETTLAERTAPEFFLTAMSGAINSAAVSDNSYNVVVADGTSTSTLVDGFSISRGKANGSSGSSQHVGAGVRILNGSAQFRRCKFISNESSIKGAGVYVSGGIPSFTDCLFYDNICTNGEGGGFASDSSLNVRLVNCEFYGNSAVGNAGGALFSGGPGELVNCVFSGNDTSSTLSYGGAIYADNESADLIVRNCTIAHNFCAGLGGGIAIRNGADATIRNTILWGNTDPIVNNTTNENLYNDVNAGSTYVSSFTTLQGLAGAAGANPLFVDADGGDNTIGTTDDNCRLQITSPAIDAGDNAQVSADVTDINQNANFVEQIPVDVLGNARRVNINSIADTGSGGSPMVDRGAYETPVPPCLGDLNADGFRDTADLVIFLGQFGQSGANLTADFNNDNIVNTNDLTQFLGVFGVPCL